MLKKIACIATLFASMGAIADNGVYVSDNGKLDIRNGSYFCGIYPSGVLSNFKEFPPGHFPRAMLRIEHDEEGKYLVTDLHPNIPMSAKPSPSWGSFGATVKLESSSNNSVKYKEYVNDSNYAFLIGSEKLGMMAILSTDDAFSPINAVLGKCEKMNSY
ncbi:hypothetical protein [Xenorhabdus bovienii]|uniref:hypothetical protein n=1 Tax=Xenorhabdus bovienii TaxID=40576 RepID=UPI0021574163|nr:hypothetical protein [Xenorhabdus bovienii]